LQAQPLGYRIVRQNGSHRKMEAPNHPTITFAFHDNQTIRPSTVKDILCNQVGLAERDAALGDIAGGMAVSAGGVFATAG
jgi:predicted RNA binding protein YcfA (HicA-like mRNA interferase family)